MTIHDLTREFFLDVKKEVPDWTDRVRDKRLAGIEPLEARCFAVLRDVLREEGAQRPLTTKPPPSPQTALISPDCLVCGHLRHRARKCFGADTRRTEWCDCTQDSEEASGVGATKPELSEMRKQAEARHRAREG